MSSIAKTHLTSSMKKLYGMRETENMTDFIIESENILFPNSIFLWDSLSKLEALHQWDGAIIY